MSSIGKYICTQTFTKRDRPPPENEKDRSKAHLVRMYQNFQWGPQPKLTQLMKIFSVTSKKRSENSPFEVRNAWSLMQCDNSSSQQFDQWLVSLSTRDTITKGQLFSATLQKAYNLDSFSSMRFHVWSKDFNRGTAERVQS